MKRSVFSIIIIFGLFFSISGFIPQTQANTSILLLDLVRSGISKILNNTGRYSQPSSIPNEADSDQDDLTDVQEKLFQTNPTDPHTPGISVIYDNSFKTFEYYSATDPAYLSMVPGGNQYLLKEGVVIRRGTTFKIAAINSGTTTMTINGLGLTELTPVRDLVFGGWNVTVPINGTVGTYTATITDGAWSKSMPIYVIFELPADLTQAQIGAFVYDDDPTNKRDEVAVWWRAVDWKYYNSDSLTRTPCLPSNPICSNWQYHTVSGYAQAFWTEQFTKNVLLNYTLPAINGITTQYTASVVIGIKADQSVRVNFASVKNSFSTATKIFYDPVDFPKTPYSMNGGGCETSAGVYTAMLRSVGIPSEPFALDYNKTLGHGDNGDFALNEYDTAVMMWVHGPTDASTSWYAERSFNDAESEYQRQPVWASGTSGIRPLAKVGIYDPLHPENQFDKYQDAYSDVIQAANENWDFQNGSLGGGMVNTAWTGTDIPTSEFTPLNRDFIWNSKYPLEIQQSPYVDILNCQLWKGDNWAPSEWFAPGSLPDQSNPPGRSVNQTYYLPAGVPSKPGDIENWPYNPKPTSCSDSTTASACATFKFNWQPVCPVLPGQGAQNVPTPYHQKAQSSSLIANPSVSLWAILSDWGIDPSGDGRFDLLDVGVQLNNSQGK